MTAPHKKTSELEWGSHFMTDKSGIRWIYTRERDGSPITVMQVRLKRGVTLPEHVHRHPPDLIYVLKGKTTRAKHRRPNL